MKTIIIYYSQNRNTKIVAETLSKELCTDIVRIYDKKKRNSFKNKITASIDAFRENKTEIRPSNINLEEYGMIYFGTPTWAGKPVPAMITIIDRCNLKGKDVVVFATMNGSGGQTALNRMEEKIQARGGRVVESFTIRTKDKSPLQIQEDSESIAKLLDLSLFSN